jgi:phage-related minor tail protein
MADDTEEPTLTVRIDADTTALQHQLADCARLGARFGSTLSNSFVDLAVRGRGLGDVLRSLTFSLSQIAVRAAFKPLTDTIGSSLAGLFGGAVPFANGGVVPGPMPIPFARGGVISTPMTFPLGGNRLGIAGEQGPEAIMPLARGPDGRLGVRADAAGATHITFNITTPDSESFRRSEAQLSAMLARAVGSGQRNL